MSLVSPRATKKSQSQERTSNAVNLTAIDMPEDYHTSSEALRMLKKHNDQTNLMKGRLSVLQIHEEKNDFKAFLNEQRYQFHQQMRN